MKKKVIIITGGGGLLGKEVILDLHRKGHIPINADVNVEIDLDKHQHFCDVRDVNSIEVLLKNVYEKYGQINGLVNNAYPRTKDWGIGFEELQIESLRQNIDWQLNSYVIFCKLVLPYLRLSGGGSVVNMSSIYGVVGNNFTIYEDTGMEPPIAYSAIKGGLINVTRFLASKYGKEHIRFNCVSPGGIFDNQCEKFVKAYNELVPMKRMGSPDDIAPAVSFLLSDESKYITGQNIIVDGGWTCI